MYDFSMNDFQKKLFIVFYEENGEFLTVYYADGNIEHYENTEANKERLNLRMKKQVEDAFKAMDYSDLRLYDGVSNDTLMFIMQSESDKPLDINTIDTLSFEDLIRMVDNYNAIVLDAKDKSLKMDFKNEEDN